MTEQPLSTPAEVGTVHLRRYAAQDPHGHRADLAAVVEQLAAAGMLVIVAHPEAAQLIAGIRDLDRASGTATPASGRTLLELTHTLGRVWANPTIRSIAIVIDDIDELPRHADALGDRSIAALWLVAAAGGDVAALRSVVGLDVTAIGSAANPPGALIVAGVHTTHPIGNVEGVALGAVADSITDLRTSPVVASC